MIGTDIDLKAISRKGQRLTLRNDFTGGTNAEKLASQSLCCFSSGSFKTNFSTKYNICESGNLVDQQWSDCCTITSI